MFRVLGESTGPECHPISIRRASFSVRSLEAEEGRWGWLEKTDMECSLTVVLLHWREG